MLIGHFVADVRYISQAELASVSSYMRGRLTIETVNTALDDAAAHAEANSKLMAAARSNSVKAADRKRATTLLHCVAVGRHFMLHACVQPACEPLCSRHSTPYWVLGCFASVSHLHHE